MENGDDIIDGYYEYLENTEINFHSQPEPNIEEAPTRGDGVVQEEARTEATENAILWVNTNGGEHQDYPIVPNLPMVQAAQDCLEVNIQLRRNEEDAGEGLLMLHTMQEVPNGIDLLTIAALLLSSAVAPEIGSSTAVVV